MFCISIEIRYYAFKSLNLKSDNKKKFINDAKQVK